MSAETSPAGGDGATGRGYIVVGVDGSSGSRTALRWAAQEARVRGVPLHALFAWEGIGVRVAQASGWVKAVTREMEEEAAAGVITEAVSSVLGDHPGTEVVVEAVPGEGAEALIAASKDADLLVVGSRGDGGFAGLRLGSVSQKCTHHARCPVVVVPDPDTLD